MPQQEQFAALDFPCAGVDQTHPYSAQRPKPMPMLGGEYGRTTVYGRNVRSFDSLGRMRGGSRPGLVKYVTQAVGNIPDWIVQDISTLVATGPGGAVQFSQAGRVVNLLGVSQGNVYYAPAGSTTWLTPVNSTGDNPPLNFTGIVLSASNNQRMFYADGTNSVYFDPFDLTVKRWAATAGALPVDSDNNKPRLIETWRGRTVESGLLSDGQNWFMSAVNDPFDWDYAPTNPTPTQAVAGNNAPQGMVGDTITSMCPYSDDVLIFFGDHTIYLLAGDPMAGGQLDLVTDAIGGTWGRCWAKDPYGTVYFVSNRTGIFSLVPGQKPQRISQGIEQLVQNIDSGNSVVRCMWDDRFQGLHVFVTYMHNPQATQHLFWEQRTGAWWPTVFANNDHNPVCCVVFDGNLPADRVALIGGWDGYVRSFDPDATDDDGTAIVASVLIGPLNTKDLDDLLLKDLQVILGESSADVTYAIYSGATAELALSSPAVLTGTWSAGRNLLTFLRISGHALYIQITSSQRWAMEQIRARLGATGKVRRRGY
jgi:hypothetical protein